MLDAEQYNELLERLKEVVRNELKNEQKLWDLQAIADYFGVSVTTVRRYRKNPSFPKPTHIPYEKSPEVFVATTRWYPNEIIKWGRLWREVA